MERARVSNVSVQRHAPGKIRNVKYEHAMLVRVAFRIRLRGRRRQRKCRVIARKINATEMVASWWFPTMPICRSMAILVRAMFVRPVSRRIRR